MEFTTVKGFKDILPEETGLWRLLESRSRSVFRSFGFKEIHPPLLEQTELFSRGIGEDTDIVSKEMYTFADSKGRSFALRPEATASVVRAYIQHRLYLTNPVRKLFVIGPMFRHERPQKGRFRQFHQIDAEILGDAGPRSDADLILLLFLLFETIGLPDLSLHLNSLGCPECRNPFRNTLKDFLATQAEHLCSDCRRRAETNPLRVFDCKVDTCRDVVEKAPSISDHICEECGGHFHRLQEYLRLAGVPFVLDPRLVRGLNYYTRTAFELQTDRLGAQNAVAGGGRYDGLVKLLGGPDHPGIGFAIGVERLVALLQEERPPRAEAPDLFVAGLGERAERETFGWIMDLRRSGLWVEMDYGSKGLKAQMKRADKLGAKRVLIVGDDELTRGRVVLRDLRTKSQEEIGLEDLLDHLKAAR